jgi:hypothetical protein
MSRAGLVSVIPSESPALSEAEWVEGPRDMSNDVPRGSSTPLTLRSE